MKANDISWISLLINQLFLFFHKFQKHFLRWQPGDEAAAGLPGGKGARPETTRMGNRLGATSGALISMFFVLLFENSYSKPMKIHIFCMFFDAPRGPTYGRPFGRCQRSMICVFSAFWAPFFALAPKFYENVYTFQACARPAKFRIRFLRIFGLENVVFYDFHVFLLFFECLH